MPVDIRATFQRMTERAILVTHNDENIWLPKSHVSFSASTAIADLQTGTEHTLRLSDWIARQKNILPEATVNEELYAAQIPLTSFSGPCFAVRHSNGEVMCYAPTEQKARMIAAALILTEGKV